MRAPFTSGYWALFCFLLVTLCITMAAMSQSPETDSRSNVQDSLVKSLSHTFTFMLFYPATNPWYMRFFDPLGTHHKLFQIFDLFVLCFFRHLTTPSQKRFLSSIAFCFSFKFLLLLFLITLIFVLGFASRNLTLCFCFAKYLLNLVLLLTSDSFSLLFTVLLDQSLFPLHTLLNLFFLQSSNC